MRNSAGQTLREAREEKQISLQAAAQDINMTARHLQALEDDNYSIFAGEIYTLGFLRSYANYLDLDSEKVIQLYKGAQLVEKEVPLKELTKPTVTAFDHMQKYVKWGAGLLIIIIGSVIIYNLANNNSGRPTIVRNENVDNDTDPDKFINKDDTNIPSAETENVTFRNGYVNAIITVGKGINFSIENREAFLVLRALNYKTATDGKSAAVFDRYPGKTQVKLFEGQSAEVSDEKLARKYKLTLMGATPNNVKIQIDLGARLDGKSDAEVKEPENENTQPFFEENFKIRFRARTTGDNFVEFYVDGELKNKGLLASDSRLEFNANDRIQFKIGDAGAIDIKINGKDYKFGRPGQQVKKVIRKLKDPQTQKLRIQIDDL